MVHGALLRELREARGKTQRDVVRKAEDVCRDWNRTRPGKKAWSLFLSTYQRIESGEEDVMISKLQIVHEAFRRMGIHFDLAAVIREAA